MSVPHWCETEPMTTGPRGKHASHCTTSSHHVTPPLHHVTPPLHHVSSLGLSFKILPRQLHTQPTLYGFTIAGYSFRELIYSAQSNEWYAIGSPPWIPANPFCVFLLFTFALRMLNISGFHSRHFHCIFRCLKSKLLLIFHSDYSTPPPPPHLPQTQNIS